jgi:hypothetical protein
MSFHLPNLPHVSAQKLVNWFAWQCTWGFTLWFSASYQYEITPNFTCSNKLMFLEFFQRFFILKNNMQNMKQRFHYELQITWTFVLFVEYLLKSRKFYASLCSAAALLLITSVSSRIIPYLHWMDMITEEHKITMNTFWNSVYFKLVHMKGDILKHVMFIFSYILFSFLINIIFKDIVSTVKVGQIMTFRVSPVE